MENIMPRRPLIRSNQHFYHVYNRSNHKLWFSCSMDKVWKIAVNSLNHAYKKHPAVIAQFVLMSNHYHMLIRTPDKNLDKFMYEFGKNFSLKLRIETKLINRMFSGRYKWSLIKDNNHLEKIFDYIYQNPIRAKVVAEAHYYPYSTAKRNNDELEFPIEKLYKLNSKKENLHDKEVVKISRSLKKSIYKLVKS